MSGRIQMSTHICSKVVQYIYGTFVNICPSVNHMPLIRFLYWMDFKFQSLIFGAILEQGSFSIQLSVSCWSKLWTCIFAAKVGNLLFIRLNRSFSGSPLILKFSS